MDIHPLAMENAYSGNDKKAFSPFQAIV